MKIQQYRQTNVKDKIASELYNSVLYQLTEEVAREQLVLKDAA